MTQSNPELEKLVQEWKAKHGLAGLLLLQAAVEKLRTEAQGQK